MTASLGALYHWSPRDRLSSIKRLGLVPGKRNITGPLYHGTPENLENWENEDLGAGEFFQSGICFATDPASAWSLSHGVFRVLGTYDLWQVSLVDADSVEILPQWGARIREVRVRNRILKSRLIWIGERTVDSAMAAK